MRRHFKVVAELYIIKNTYSLKCTETNYNYKNNVDVNFLYVISNCPINNRLLNPWMHPIKWYCAQLLSQYKTKYTCCLGDNASPLLVLYALTLHPVILKTLLSFKWARAKPQFYSFQKWNLFLACILSYSLFTTFNIHCNFTIASEIYSYIMH